MVALRQRPITDAIRSRLISVRRSERVLPNASLFGRRSADNSLKRMQVGSATATPKVNTSRVPREGINEIRLAAASETAERTNAWSHSFDNRMTNSVEHWDRIVGSISAGRCVTKPRYTPYLRPFLAMRESARRVGPKPILRSADAQRWASSQTNNSGET